MNKIDLKNPIELQTSRAWRTYLGGKMIDELHGKNGVDSNFPEEWLMSAVCARNSGREHMIEGISMVKDTELTLKEFIEIYPVEMLGQGHFEKYGANMGVLVKLLDAAERLTVQVHPTRKKARELFQSPFGKTECWHILGVRTMPGEKPCIYIGFREGVTRELWKDCFDRQDIPQMLNCLNRIDVNVGDTFIIKGGVPHAIGAGCFLTEIQEPTDYTVRTERVTPSGLEVADFMCHQGLGFDRMFDCFDYDGVSEAEVLRRWRVEEKREQLNGCTVHHVIYPQVTDMFGMDIIETNGCCRFETNGVFCGLYVLSGGGRINGKKAERCSHFFVPAGCKEIVLESDIKLEIIRCFGPRSSHVLPESPFSNH